LNPGRRDTLLRRLYGAQSLVGSNAVQVHIHNLRRKLDPFLIRRVRGFGYRLEAR